MCFEKGGLDLISANAASGECSVKTLEGDISSGTVNALSYVDPPTLSLARSHCFAIITIPVTWPCPGSKGSQVACGYRTGEVKRFTIDVSSSHLLSSLLSLHRT